MCTVLFLPYKNSIYFASLRDESPKRPVAIAPALQATNESRFLAPVDPLAGGTWIGVNEFRNVIILLNGGFEKHTRNAPYQKSRGKIVTELLNSSLAVVDWNLMALEGIEPFTLIIWSEEKLFQLIWDGSKKHRTHLDASVAHMWSSSTLYDNAAKEKKQDFFQNWMAMNPPISKLAVLNFFNSIDDKENGFLIERYEKIKTLSYSFIEINNSNLAQFDYYDFISYKHSSETIEMRGSSTDCFLLKADQTTKKSPC